MGIVLSNMPNFDLTTPDGIGLFFQIFASGFAFLQVYRFFRKTEKPMSEIQWFGNSLLLSLLVISIFGYLNTHSAKPLPTTGMLSLGMTYIVLGLFFGGFSALIMNFLTWISENYLEIWKVLTTDIFKKKVED